MEGGYRLLEPDALAAACSTTGRSGRGDSFDLMEYPSPTRTWAAMASPSYSSTASSSFRRTCGRNAGFGPSEDFRYIALDPSVATATAGSPRTPTPTGSRWSRTSCASWTTWVSTTPTSRGYSSGRRSRSGSPPSTRSGSLAGRRRLRLVGPREGGRDYAGVAMGLAASPTVGDMVMAGMPRGHAPGAARLPIRSMEAHGIDSTTTARPASRVWPDRWATSWA